MTSALQIISPPRPARTIAALIHAYRTDPVSDYRKIRHATRKNYDALCRRLEADIGGVDVSEIRFRTVREWHAGWSADGKITMAHSLVSMVRTLIGYGAHILEDDECGRVRGLLHGAKFAQGGARTSFLTAEQATVLRAKAHEMGHPSIAMAQAFQFDCGLRQKDVIGEYVPREDPAKSDLIVLRWGKWVRGLTWQEIDADLILRHTTSKRGKAVEMPLRLCPMVMEEIDRLGSIPAGGPIIIAETNALPYPSHEFRRLWRSLARLAGIPDHVQNRDSRAGAISEATDAGAELEHVRHFATHSDIAMTARYSRNTQSKVENVMKRRIEHRAGR